MAGTKFIKGFAKVAQASMLQAVQSSFNKRLGLGGSMAAQPKPLEVPKPPPPPANVTPAGYMSNRIGNPFG